MQPSNGMRNIYAHILANYMYKERPEEIVLARIRIGHTYFTHNYLLREEDQPECSACLCPMTVKHILIECADFLHVRRKYFNVLSLRELFDQIHPTKIISFVKEIGLFYHF